MNSLLPPAGLVGPLPPPSGSMANQCDLFLGPVPAALALYTVGVLGAPSIVKCRSVSAATFVADAPIDVLTSRLAATLQVRLADLLCRVSGQPGLTSRIVSFCGIGDLSMAPYSANEE
jgi:hypothetical protein